MMIVVPFFADLLHAAVALGLEKDIPDRERLINDQDPPARR